MTDFVIPPDDMTIILKEEDSLGLYQFDTKIAYHYFCKICGIFPFLQTMRIPEHYRINLGCVDRIDYDNLQVDLFDGKNL